MNAEKSSAPRILIVKLSAVGDVVHTLPALNAIREAFPQAHIGWAVHPGVANLLERHPQINELIVLPRRWKQFGGIGGFRQHLARLRSKGWDWALDFQGLTKSGLVAWLSRANHVVGFGNEASRELNWLFTKVKVSPTDRAVIQMNLGLLDPLGIKPTSAKAVLRPQAEDLQLIRAWAQNAKIDDEKFIVMDPFAGWVTKLWPHENWIEVAHRIWVMYGIRPLVVHGPGEKDAASELSWKMFARKCPAVLAPATTLRQYLALLRMHGLAMVGADTGPMHMATAAGIPTVAMFGPSDSRRNSPTFTGAKFESLQDFSEPCAGTFARECKFHEPGHCMDKITSQMVIQALIRLMKDLPLKDQRDTTERSSAANPVV